MNISKNSVASINYTLKNSSGEVLDSSESGDPLAYIHGLGHIVPGLEEALDGKVKGDKFKISIPPEKGYGDRNEQMIQTLPRTQFEGVEDIAVGMQFHGESADGDMLLTIVEIKGDELVVDGNHPLAGLDLHFDIEVLEVRAATEEEISHGHIHGPGGHVH